MTKPIGQATPTIQEAELIIEELEAENDKLDGLNAALDLENKALEAENKRLREALEVIVTEYNYQSDIKDLIDTARQALESEDE